MEPSFRAGNYLKSVMNHGSAMKGDIGHSRITSHVKTTEEKELKNFGLVATVHHMVTIATITRLSRKKTSKLALIGHSTTTARTIFQGYFKLLNPATSTLEKL